MTPAEEDRQVGKITVLLARAVPDGSETFHVMLAAASILAKALALEYPDRDQRQHALVTLAANILETAEQNLSLQTLTRH